MKGRATTIIWLMRDTLAQARTSGILWLLVAISAICILVCLTLHVEGLASLAPADQQPDFIPRSDVDAQDAERVHISGVTVVQGELSLACGAIALPIARDTRSAVHVIELALAGGVAGTLGLLLTLIWTAGFLPTFLEPHSVSILLAKPTSRATLLLGKYLGVVLVVLLNAVLLVGGTWLAIGVRTSVWDTAYLWAVPILAVQFAVFFGVSLLLAVCTRSASLSAFGAIAFWAMTWGLNYGRHQILLAPETLPGGAFSSMLSSFLNVGYWIFPKPADFGLWLFDSLGAGNYFGSVLDSRLLEAHGFSLAASIATSLAFTAYVLFASARKFQATDY
jgi:hypothetical protein